MKLSRKMRALLDEDAPEPQTKLAYLSVVDIFQDLSDEERKEVARAAQMTTCTAGKLFYSPNQYGEVIFILKKGRVQLYRMSSEGRKLVIDTLGPGTLFGEMSLVGAGLHDAFAEAMEESLICVMNRRDVEKLMLEREGLISIGRKRIGIENVAGLEKRAAG